MYLPYLRGKQYELIALRELVQSSVDFSNVCPIIEPVKSNLTPLEGTIKCLLDHQIKFILIMNPQVGDLKNRTLDLYKLYNQFEADKKQLIIPGFIISNENEFEKSFREIYDNELNYNGVALIHENKMNNFDNHLEKINSLNCIYNIVHVSHLFSLRRKRLSSLCTLNDWFNKQNKNSKYLDFPTEFFSSDYKYFIEEGCIGFSDYQTIGEQFSNLSGGPAYAVAIHLTYLDDKSKDVMVAHFVSESNDGPEDPGGKFREALEKLIQFVNEKKMESLAIDIYREYYRSGAYPGLGVVKKLSIMHHIEMMQKVLQ